MGGNMARFMRIAKRKLRGIIREEARRLVEGSTTLVDLNDSECREMLAAVLDVLREEDMYSSASDELAAVERVFSNRGIDISSDLGDDGEPLVGDDGEPLD